MDLSGPPAYDLVSAITVVAPSPLDSFLAWDGWGMIGAVAGLVSSAAVVAAVVRYFRERHRPFAGSLAFDTYKTNPHGTHGPIHTAELSNPGGAPLVIVSITLVGASGAWEAAKEPPRWYMSPGASINLPFATSNQQDAWVLLTYNSQDDVRYLYVAWFPLFTRSRAQTAHQRAFEEWKPIRAWEPWRRLPRDRSRPVGPGGAHMWAVKRPNIAQIENMMRLAALGGGTTYFSGTPAKP